MELSDHIAFIDEFGTNSFKFDKENVSTHFIVTCIIVKKPNLERVREEIEVIRKKHFQQGEMKSSNVGNDDKRRIRILSDIGTVDFQILSLVIDKRKLDGEGFGYKPSFYKFLNSLVHNDLYKIFASVDVHMDEYGTEKYMSEFIKYIRTNHQPDLWTHLNEISFQNSKSNVCIQLADFISGTLARVYDETLKSPLGDNFLQVIRKRIGTIKFFPQSYDRFVYEYDNSDRKIDPQVDELSLRLANDFISRNEDNEDSIKNLQVRTIRLLRLYRQTVSYSRYVSTKEILEHLNYDRKDKITTYFFRTKVIAKLRDQEVLIASSSNGYKLPVSMADLYDFLNHGATVIIPMLSRISKCVYMIKLITGEDMLDNINYKELRQIIRP